MKAAKEKSGFAAPSRWTWLFLLVASAAFPASARSTFLPETRVGVSAIFEPLSPPKNSPQTIESQPDRVGFSGEDALDRCVPVNRVDPSGNSDLLQTLNVMAINTIMWTMSATRTASAFRWGLVALNGIALAQDPGAFVSMGPAATAEIIAADVAAIYNGTRGLFRASLAARNAANAFEKLAAFRADIGVPAIAVDNGAKRTTSALLDIGGEAWIGRRFLGRSPNRAALNPALNPNNITRTHAEGDAFNQAANAGASADRATLYVDRDLCGACGQRGGVKSMARSLGIKEITIVTPSGSQTIVIDSSILPSTQPTAPVGLLYEILGDLE